MKNFHELTPKHILNTQTYLDHLWSFVFAEKTSLQAVASHVRTIWGHLNESRDSLDKYYMQNFDFIKAYLSSFLIPNIERSFALFSHTENMNAIRKTLEQGPETISWIDFGCGPLSGTVGFLCFLEKFYQKNPDITPPTQLKVYAIDRSEKIIHIGSDLIQESLLPQIQLTIEVRTSIEKVLEEVDFAFALNVLNEIPEKHRHKTAKAIISKIKDQGCLLILEPGQQLHSKQLGFLRDQLIEQDPSLAIVSPCVHKGPCPLAQNTGRPDWCWFKHFWTPPETLKNIDKYTKIDHYILNYSYVFFQKNTPQQEPLADARRISDVVELNPKDNRLITYLSHNLYRGTAEDLSSVVAQNERLQKTLLCTKEGELLSDILTNKEVYDNHPLRGDLVSLSRINLLAKERA